MDLIHNREKEPDMSSIKDYIMGEANIVWQNLNANIADAFQAKPKITFSVCAAKPGWNVKYKKGGKALCTLYPEKEGFVALVVLGTMDMELFDAVRQGYTAYINKLYDDVKLFNGTKWMMINVADQKIADDVLKLIHLKRAAAKKSKAKKIDKI